jgi:hypothetical protein
MAACAVRRGPNHITRKGIITSGGITRRISTGISEKLRKSLNIEIKNPIRMPRTMPTPPPMETFNMVKSKWGQMPLLPPPCVSKVVLKVNIGKRPARTISGAGNRNRPSCSERSFHTRKNSKMPTAQRTGFSQVRILEARRERLDVSTVLLVGERVVTKCLPFRLPDRFFDIYLGA